MRRNRVKATYWKRAYKSRFGSQCEICSENRAFDICHIIPVHLGGTTIEWNILILCPTHHRLFDFRRLSNVEYSKISQKVEHAKSQFSNKTWKMTMAAKVTNKSAGVIILTTSVV